MQAVRLTGVQDSDFALLQDAKDGDGDVVYVIQAESGGPVKIGHTTWEARHRRLGQLQMSNPNTLVYRRIVRGEMWLERALHAYFAPYRIRGEWFALSDKMFPLCPEAYR